MWRVTWVQHAYGRPLDAGHRPPWFAWESSCSSAAVPLLHTPASSMSPWAEQLGALPLAPRGGATSPARGRLVRQVRGRTSGKAPGPAADPATGASLKQAVEAGTAPQEGGRAGAQPPSPPQDGGLGQSWRGGGSRVRRERATAWHAPRQPAVRTERVGRVCLGARGLPLELQLSGLPWPLTPLCTRLRACGNHQASPAAGAGVPPRATERRLPPTRSTQLVSNTGAGTWGERHVRWALWAGAPQYDLSP